MSASFAFKAPDLFTAGTVGPPGQRVFYLQAREGGVIVTLKAEKEQVGALAEYLAAVLAKRPADPATGDLALLEPIAPVWAVRSLGVGYDEEGDRIVVVAEELVEGEEPEGQEEAEGQEAEARQEEADAESAEERGDAATAQFRLSRAQAAAFVARARALIQAGRPSCPVCGQPKSPEGHVCPRANGHGRGR